MATEADIPAPVCETSGNIIDKATNLSNNKVAHEEKTRADTPNELPTLEGEDFFTTPSVDKVHCEVNKTPSDASKDTEKPDQYVKDKSEILLLKDPELDDLQLEITANEDTSSERVQQNAEESNGLEKEEDGEVLPVENSGTKAGDILHQTDLDDVRVVETQLSKDTGDEKTTEEDISCNLTGQATKEEECGHNKMAPEPVGSSNEKEIVDNAPVAEEKASEENTCQEGFPETVTHVISGDEHQQKNDLNSSFSEEDIPIQEGERVVTTPQDSGIQLENTVKECDSDVEKQPQTLEDIVTNQSNPKVTEKTEESSFAQLDESRTECDEQFEKESEKLPLPEVLTESATDNESTVIDKVIDEDEYLRKTELVENQVDTSTLLKEDVETEKPLESLHVTPENITASNLSHENRTSSPEEYSTNVNIHAITSDETEEKSIDAVDVQKEVLESSSIIDSISPEEEHISTVLQGVESECTDEKANDEDGTRKEVLENFSTVVPDEEIDETSIIKVDSSETKDEEPLKKESEKTSSPLPLERDVNHDESIVMDEAQDEDGELRNVDLRENEGSTETILPKIECRIEKPEDSLNVAAENIKESDLGQEIETRSYIDEQSVTEELQTIPDERTIDAAEEKEETLENVPAAVSNDKTEENSVLQVDAKMENEDHLEKNGEEASLIEDFTGNTNDDGLTTTDEVKLEDENLIRPQLFQEEKNVECDLDQQAETTGLLEEQGLTEERTIDAADCNQNTEEMQDAAVNILKDDDNKNSLIQVDAPQTNHNTDSEKEIEKPSLDKASTKDSPEENIDSAFLKKENLQDALRNDKDSTSSEDIKTTCTLEEQSLTASPQAIIPTDTKASNVEVQNVATEIAHEPTEEDSVIQVNCSQKEHEEHLEKESENSSVTEVPTEETNDNKPKDMHEEIDRSENLKETELSEHEEKTTSTLATEEAHMEKPVDSSEAASKDIMKSDLSEDTNVSSIAVQVLTANTHEISSDKRGEETTNASVMKEESFKDIATDIPNGENEDTSSIEEDASQKPSLSDSSTEKTHENESTTTHEARLGDESSTDSYENEKNAEGTLIEEEISIQSLPVAAKDIKESALDLDTETSPLEQSLTANPQETAVKEESREDEVEHLENESENISPTEALTGNNSISTSFKDEGHEAQVEKPINSSEVAVEAIRASASEQDAETNSTEEQIIIADPQEISCDKAEERSTEASYTKGETVEDIAPNVPTGENENSSPIEIDGSQKTAVKEAFMGSDNDGESTIIHEEKLEDQKLIEAKLFENEKSSECDLVEEEVSIRSLELSGDTEASASGQDRDTSSPEDQRLTSDPSEIIDDQKLDEPIDTEIPQDKIVETTTLHEDSEKNTMDCQMEQKEPLENESEDTSPTGDTTESTLKDDTLVENAIDSFQVVTEDIEASTSSHVIEEEIITADPQGISCDKVEEKTVDATYTEEQILEDIVTSGHNKDNSPIEEASRGQANEDESAITYDDKFVDESIIKADLSESENNAEGALPKEEGSESIQSPDEDMKASASGQDKETSSLLVQSQTTDPQENIGNHQEDRTTDTTDLKEETPENKNEYSENEMGSSSLTEASTGDTTDSALLKEAHMENPIDLFQEANEDIKESTSNQETEVSSIKEETLTAEPQGTETSGVTDMKEETHEFQDNATNVPNRESEDTPPTEVDKPQKPLEEASMRNGDDHESINMHEPEFVDESSTKANLSENAETAEETSSLEDRSVTAKGIDCDNKEDETTDLSEEKDSNPIGVKVPSGNGLDVNKDMAVDIAGDPYCEQKESSITEMSEEHIMISNENVENVPSLASEASDQNSHYKIVGEVNSCSEKNNSENKGVIDDDFITIPTTEIVETDREESTVEEAQDPNVEKEAELIQQDPEAGSGESIEEELLINASQDDSESNQVNGQEKGNTNTCNEISDSSNSMTLEEVSSSNVASVEDLTPNPSQEAENEEAQKQDENLHVSVLDQDSSMEKVDNNIQLCLANANDSDIREEESSLPAPDVSITEKTEPGESDVQEDATKNENIENIKQDSTSKSLLDDQITTVREQDETECGQVLLDETAEEAKESTSTPVSNDCFPESFTEASEVDNSTIERELKKDSKELQIGKTAPDNDDETKIEEVQEEEAGKQKTPDFSSAVPNIIETRDQDVDRLPSEAPAEDSTWILKEADTVQVTSDTTAVINKTYITEIETTVDSESIETIETAPTATGDLEVENTSVREISPSTVQCERDEYEHARIGSMVEGKLESDVTEVAPEENKSEYECETQVLESSEQFQSFEIIPEAKETETEENLEVAAEIKSEVVAEDMFKPKETPYEDESMKVEKFKEDEEVLEDYPLGSRKEEVITESLSKDEVKQEEETNTDEKFEDTKNANETENASKVSEEAHDKTVEEPEKHLLPNESIYRSLHQKELVESTEDVTTILDTEEFKEDEEVLEDYPLGSRKEEVITESFPKDEVKPEEETDTDEKFEDAKNANEKENVSKVSEETDDKTVEEPEKHLLPNESIYRSLHQKELVASTEDVTTILDTEEVKSSTVGVLEDEDSKTRADDNRSQQVEEVCDESKVMAETSIPVEPATISTLEIMQEYTVGTSLEAKDQVTLDDLPQQSNIKDCEVKMARKDGPLNLQDFRDISEDPQELNDGSVEVSNKENLVDVNPSENIEGRVSSEGHKAEEIQKSLVLETLNQKKEEQQQENTSDTAPKAIGENCEEDQIVDSNSNDLVGNSSSAAAENVLESKEETAESDKRQETGKQIDSVPMLPHVKCSDTETTEKGHLMHPAGLEVTDVTRVEGSSQPSKDKHVVLEADDTNNTNPENSTGKRNISAVQQGDSVEANLVDEESTNQETKESREESEPNEADIHSLSDLLQVSVKGNKEMAYHSAIEEDPTIHREDLHPVKSDEAEHQDAKSDEGRDGEEESSEQIRSDLCSEAPVMVDMGDADVKNAHKKSHNLLSGVGSKVKHSIAKVKKAITGKSSHPKPPSPK